MKRRQCQRDRVQPVVGLSYLLPDNHVALAGDELLNLLFGREVFDKLLMFVRRLQIMENRHRPGRVRGNHQPLVDPRLPLIGVDVNQRNLVRLNPGPVVPVADDPNRVGLGLRLAVSTILLLEHPKTLGRPKAFLAALATESIDRLLGFRVARIDPSLTGHHRFTVRPWPAGEKRVSELSKGNQRSRLH